ncbi:Formin-like protein [Vigna angularis]|uniref:Formin-like protein n=1 Tax=Phaseolus angularis TaxID=3914 RepID=A0A8T0KCG6_PHAAN|nr:Formin-like protein [Vigna angularis]
MKLKNIMELTRPNYAVVYVILLCALAQGGSEGKGGKEDESSRVGGGASIIYVHRLKVANDGKPCRKQLIDRNLDLHPLEGSGDIKSIKSNINRETNFLPLHIKRKTLDGKRTSSSPVSEKGSSRYLSTEHSGSTLGVERGHGRNLLADSPKKQTAPSPSPTPASSPLSPSNGPTPARSPLSPSHAPTPATSPPSTPPPTPKKKDLPLPKDMFAPFPPLPPIARSPPKNSKPTVQTPAPPTSSADDKKKKTIILATTLSGVVILIGLFLCYRETKKKRSDRDDRPLLVLTSDDYTGGTRKVVQLGNSRRDEYGIGDGKNPSNVRNLSSRKGVDVNVSMVDIASSSSEGGRKLTVSPSAHAPPAPPKPVGGANHGPLLPKEGSSNDGDAQAPKPKLKPFFWDKVNAKPGQTMVWHEISSGSFVINEEMMESLFGCANQNKNDRKRDSSLENSVQYIKLIDPRKAQNLSILLRALNVTTEEVVDALVEGNEIPIELIQTLLKMAPTQDEELKLRLFTGQLHELGPAERFLKVLIEIPFAFKRLECLLFMHNLQEDFSSIKESFATLEVASNDLRKSRLFLKLLEAVLKTGNRMNDGTYRGRAQAFRLDTLLKLSDVKGTDGKTTLLHFVVEEIIRSEGIRAARNERASRSISSVNTSDESDEGEESEEHYRSVGLQVVSSLGAELEAVKKAALIDGDALTTTVSKLGHSLVKTQNFLDTDMKNIVEESEFQNSMEQFMVNARKEVMWMVEEEKRIMALVKSTADYFHGNAGKDEGLRLFLIVRDFLIILDKVCKEVRDTTMTPAKAPTTTKKKPKTPTASSPNARNPDSPKPSTNLHSKLFPAIAGRRMDYSSSDSSDDDDD